MLRPRPSPALIVALVALVVALGGASAVAAPAVKRMIDGRQIRRASLPGDRVKPRSLAGDRFKRDALGGAQIEERTLAIVPRAARAESADRADSATRADSAATADTAAHADRAAHADTAERADSAARADVAGSADRVATIEQIAPVRIEPPPLRDADFYAQPEVVLATRGPFTLYGKCHHDVSLGGDTVHGVIFARTSSPGSLFTSTLRGTGIANVEPASPEPQRWLARADFQAAPGEFDISRPADFLLTDPSGAVARGNLLVLVKNGSLPGGQGAFGEGSGCIFSGTIGA